MKFNPFFKKENIHEGREAKEDAIGQEISIFNGVSNKYQEISAQVTGALIDAELKEHQAWIESKLNEINKELPDKSMFSLEELLKTLKTVFGKRVRLQAKLDGVKPENLFQDKKIDDIFSQAVFDFIQSLKSSTRRHDRKSTALNLAEQSYLLNPNTIEELERNNPDIDSFVIKQAVLKHPMNPQAYIDGYTERIGKLTTKYPDVDSSVLVHAALHNHEKPEQFVDSYVKRLNELLIIYPDLNKSVIKMAALNYPGKGKAQEYIAGYITRISDLEAKYKNAVPPYIIKQAAKNHPSDPNSFIEENK